MKKKTPTTRRPRRAGIVTTAVQHPLLSHALSPLELAAYKNGFRKFTYQLQDLPLVIDRLMARELFVFAKQHTLWLQKVFQKTRQAQLRKAPALKRFLDSSLQQQPLPRRLINTLRKAGCSTINDVAALGPRALHYQRGIGKAGMAALKQLFAKHGCSSLLE